MEHFFVEKYVNKTGLGLSIMKSIPGSIYSSQRSPMKTNCGPIREPLDFSRHYLAHLRPLKADPSWLKWAWLLPGNVTCIGAVTGHENHFQVELVSDALEVLRRCR